jgi:hypothetical protein
MRTLAVTTTLLSLCLVACDPSPLAVSPDQPLHSVGGGAVADLPISGTCQASLAEPPVFTPPILHQVSTGTCQLSHLGRVSLRTVAQINVAIGVQVAEITYTAASGELMFASSIGTATPGAAGILHFTGVTTIIGGTGRFTGASGVMNATGTLDSSTGNASFSYEGQIAYSAGSRGGR